MRKTLRASLTLVASLALMAGVAACGDDGDEAADDTTSTTEQTTTTEAAAEEGGEEGGPPEENPCGEGGSGMLAPPEAPADGATEVTITAADYSFEGIDELAAAGTAAVTFTNEGNELHELMVMKIADGEERPIEELLQLPDEEAEQVASPVGMTFACPGATAEPTGMDLSEAGRYVAICFIPVGTMPETDFATMSEDGKPHFMEGMVEEFQVA